MLTCYKAQDATAAYYVVTATDIWMAWVWTGADYPPKTLNDPTYRWQLVGVKG